MISMKSIDAGWIEQAVPAGRSRWVLDLFRGTGTPSKGALIADFCVTYQVTLILVHETRRTGARVLVDEILDLG